MTPHDPKLPWRVHNTMGHLLIVDCNDDPITIAMPDHPVLAKNLQRAIAAVNATQHETIDDLVSGVVYNKLKGVQDGN